MNIIQGVPFFKEVTTTGESDKFTSHCYTDGSIEFKGTATSFSAEIQGCIDTETTPNWITLCVVDESNFNTLTAISAKGIYSFNAMGKSIRVKLNSISGGNLTVVGKFLN